MSKDNRSQWELAKQALSILFQNNVRFILVPETRFERVWIPDYAVPNMESCIDFLKKNTGRGESIDPFESADGTSWVTISQVLSRKTLREMALEVSLQYLRVCYELQLKENARVHKGAPLYWASQRNYEMGKIEEARGLMLLAFVEDTAEYSKPRDPRKAPAYAKLTAIYGFSASVLENLLTYTIERIEKFSNFPEDALLDWELHNATKLGEFEDDSHV